MIFNELASKSQPYCQDSLAIILAGGNGRRLGELTQWRPKPALPFGGKYRSIDFPLSNCVHSGLRRIGILTQYKAHELIQHVQLGWQFLHPPLNEFIEVWPAQQRVNGNWYAGTGDAVFQNIDIIKQHDPKYVVILAGDHVYNMNYADMIRRHVESSADVTVGAIEVPLSEASAFGVMTIDRGRRIVRFEEKPLDPAALPNKPERALASMGIYVISTNVLIDLLVEDANKTNSRHDFGKDIVPSAIGRKTVMAFPFLNHRGDPGFWRDIGTIDSFWRANIDLLNADFGLQLHDPEWPVWTFESQHPPARFVKDSRGRHGMAVDSLVSNGCVITGSTVQHSVISTNVSIAPDCEILDSVVLPDAKIGRNCRLSRCVIDSNFSVPAGTVIGVDKSADERLFDVTERGIVLVTKAMFDAVAADLRESHVA